MAGFPQEKCTYGFLNGIIPSVAVPVPNPDEFWLVEFSAAEWATRPPTDGSLDNTFVGQNSSFFFFSLLLPSFFLLINFNFGHRYE